jgi:hypothetical protein
MLFFWLCSRRPTFSPDFFFFFFLDELGNYRAIKKNTKIYRNRRFFTEITVSNAVFTFRLLNIKLGYCKCSILKLGVAVCLQNHQTAWIYRTRRFFRKNSGLEYRFSIFFLRIWYYTILWNKMKKIINKKIDGDMSETCQRPIGETSSDNQKTLFPIIIMYI